MFFDALFKLALVFVLGTFLTSFIWLSIYRLLGFLMPDWLAGWFARPIIWVRHQKPEKVARIALISSVIVGILLWHDLWFWMIFLGGSGALAVWFFSER